MSVRAKFRVGKITDVDGYHGKGKSIELHAVGGPDDASKENKRFFNSTPTGSITLNCVNPDANVQFEEGKEYYVDFHAADDSGGSNGPGTGQDGKP